VSPARELAGTATAGPARIRTAATVRGPAVVVGLVLDRLLGDPPDRWHPVAWFGSAMTARERRAWHDSRLAGAAHAAVGVAVGAGTAGLLTAASRQRRGGRAAVTALTVAAVVGGRGLDRAAAAIAAALDAGDLDEARRLLPGLVGRDPAGLDAAEVARAVIESVAENTVDAVIAPALWAAVGGAAGAGAYRAVNTLDAMVGHRSDRYRNFGWASARTDDLANLVPARLSALLVAAVRPRRAGAVWRAVRADAPAHPSPNAGVVEAAFAAALGIRLGGTNVYRGQAEERGTLGTGRPPVTDDIAAARALARDVTVALCVVLLGVGLLAARWAGRPAPAVAATTSFLGINT
jgi:adenosylcobinamide-phosphate synthase